VLSLVIASAFSYRLISDYLYERLDSHVLERFQEIRNSYTVRGIDGAVAMIRDHGAEIRGEETLYVLSTVDGKQLIANGILPQVAEGMSTQQATADGTVTSTFRINRELFDGYDLTVGVSYDDTNTLFRIEFFTFVSSTVLVLSLGLGAAIYMAVHTRRRLLALSSVMDDVGKGRLDSRLPLSERGDDIDALAMGMNDALGHLEDSVNAMQRVATHIAHDLKTPINRLRLTLESAVNSVGLQGAVRQPLDQAIVQVDRMAKTFEALLRIAEIETGSRRRFFQTIDLLALVEDVSEICYPIVEDSGRTLTNMSTARGVIWGDYNLLRQLLFNLISNSCMHTPPGTNIVVHIQELQNNPVLVVSDDGPGIPFESGTQVFNRFVRLGGTGSDGTGLGLSIVKAIVDIHSAEIKLTDNKPGLAATIRFPVHDAQTPRAQRD
jgi:signal transduction histidine kinase